MTLTATDATRIAAELIANCNRMEHEPGRGPTQIGLMQAAAGFTIAAAILDLAAAVRGRGAVPAAADAGTMGDGVTL